MFELVQMQFELKLFFEHISYVKLFIVTREVTVKYKTVEITKYRANWDLHFASSLINL